jgi:hypothetical protein
MRAFLLTFAADLHESRLAICGCSALSSLLTALAVGAGLPVAVLSACLAFALGVCVGLIVPDLLVHVLVPGGRRSHGVVVLGGNDSQPEERARDVENLGQRRGGA